MHSLIESYELRETRSYNRRYLSSWSAETYEVELSTAALEARSRAYDAEKKKIKRSMYQLRNFSTSSADLAITSYKLLLLPLWMTTYPYEGQDRTVLINGQNGEVFGEMPKKTKKENGNGGLMGWLDEIF